MNYQTNGLKILLGNCPLELFAAVESLNDPVPPCRVIVRNPDVKGKPAF